MNDNKNERETRTNQTTDREVLIVDSRRRGIPGWAWTLFAVTVVLLVLWMSGVGESLTRIKQTVNHNAGVLSQQQSELPGIQAHLNAIGSQLSQLQNEVRTFFTNVWQAIHH